MESSIPARSSTTSVQQNKAGVPPAGMSRMHINGRLYVDGMAPGTGEADLRRHFGHYGDVAHVYIPTYRLTGLPRRSAFVQFSSPGSGARALADPRHFVNGREVYVTRAGRNHLEETSASHYIPPYHRQVQDGPWLGYRIGDIGKVSLGQDVHGFVINYISEDGLECWGTPIDVQSDGNPIRYGPRQH